MTPSTRESLGHFAGYRSAAKELPPQPCPYAVGDRVRFKPAAFSCGVAGFGGELNVRVEGTVIRVHEDHRWYRVSWEYSPGCTGYETFKY